MRLLLLTWEFPPSVIGGLGRHVDRLSEALVADGHEVHVLTRAAPDEAVETHEGNLHVHRVSDGGIDVHLDGFVQYVVNLNGKLLEKGHEFFNAEDFDLIHAHDWLVAHVADDLRRAYGVPLVSTIHATEYGRHQGWLPNDMNRRIHQIDCGLAHISRRVITCSDYMEEQIRSIFDLPAFKIRVIRNGVAVRIDPCCGPVEKTRHTVLFVGRLEYEKGVQTIIEAAPRVIDQLPHTRFLVAGHGTYEDDLRKQVATLGLSHSFEFLGFVEESEMSALYQQASLLVAPSIYEPFGLVVLEAMACGIPVVVGDTGGLRELVQHGENGLRIPPERVRLLSFTIIRVLTDVSLRRRLIEGGLQSVAELSWDQIARRTVAVYQEAIDENAAGSGIEEKRLSLVWKESAAYRDAIRFDTSVNSEDEDSECEASS